MLGQKSNTQLTLALLPVQCSEVSRVFVRSQSQWQLNEAQLAAAAELWPLWFVGYILIRRCPSAKIDRPHRERRLQSTIGDLDSFRMLDRRRACDTRKLKYKLFVELIGRWVADAGLALSKYLLADDQVRCLSLLLGPCKLIYPNKLTTTTEQQQQQFR